MPPHLGAEVGEFVFLIRGGLVVAWDYRPAVAREHGAESGADAAVIEIEGIFEEAEWVEPAVDQRAGFLDIGLAEVELVDEAVTLLTARQVSSPPAAQSRPMPRVSPVGSTDSQSSPIRPG